MGKVIIIYTFVFCAFTSCVITHKVPAEIKDEFTYCYNHGDMYNDSVLNFNGYFSFSTKTERSSKVSDNIIFFEDGSLVSFMGGVNRLKTNDEYSNRYDSLLIQLYNRKDSVEKDYMNWSFYNSGEWGFYKISNDTIYTQRVFRPNPGLLVGWTWYTYTKLYKIIDRNTIIKINPQKYDLTIKGSFKKLELVPEPNHWLKNERWVWCDKVAYDSLQTPRTKRELKKEARHYRKVYKELIAE